MRRIVLVAADLGKIKTKGDQSSRQLVRGMDAVKSWLSQAGGEPGQAARGGEGPGALAARAPATQH